MKAVLFTKLFRGLDLGEIAAKAAMLEFDGIDLLVRPGHQIEPDGADAIGAAVRRLRGEGLDVPMVTTDLYDPEAYPADRVLGNCAGAGVRLVRLGYWRYDPKRGYVAVFADARRHLDALERLARAHGVCLLIQVHGGTIHSSGALTARLLDGHDPAHLGAYPDPGNQAVQEGREAWRLTFDLLRPWLRCVGVKNGGWFPAEVRPSGQRRWESDWLGLADGMVPWDEIIPYLVESGYDGLLSLHSHNPLPYAQVLDQTRTDLRYVRRLLNVRQAIAS
jgi:sugar phosphate isomerase/epimerase